MVETYYPLSTYSQTGTTKVHTARCETALKHTRGSTGSEVTEKQSKHKEIATTVCKYLRYLTALIALWELIEHGFFAAKNLQSTILL